MKRILIGIIVALILCTGYFYLGKRKYKKEAKANYENVLRWKDNYTTAVKGFILDTLGNGNVVAKFNEVILTKDELLHSKDLELFVLRDKVKKNDIKIKDLESYINIQSELFTTLTGLMDSLVSMTDGYTTVDLEFYADSIRATVTVKTDIDVFVKNTKVLYKPVENRNGFGRWWVDTKLGFKLAKKYIKPEVQLNMNNPHIKINSVKYIDVK